ncbi:hypothetical protein AOQ84DRAFT_143873, partial [Glonium stellatum]
MSSENTRARCLSNSYLESKAPPERSRTSNATHSKRKSFLAEEETLVSGLPENSSYQNLQHPSNIKSSSSECGDLERNSTSYPSSDQIRPLLQLGYVHLPGQTQVEIGIPPLPGPLRRSQSHDIRASTILPSASNTNTSQFTYGNTKDGFPFRTSDTNDWERGLKRQYTSTSFPRNSLSDNEIPRRPVPRRTYCSPLPFTSPTSQFPQSASRKPLTYASFAGRSPYDAPSIRSAPSPKPSQLSHSSQRGRSYSLGSRTPEARLSLTQSAHAEHALVPVIPESPPESEQRPPPRSGYGRRASQPPRPGEEPATLQPQLTYAHTTPRARLTRDPPRSSSHPKRLHDTRVKRSDPHTPKRPTASHTPAEPRSSTTTTTTTTTPPPPPPPPQTAPVPLCPTCRTNIARETIDRLEESIQARHWLAVILRITLW